MTPCQHQLVERKHERKHDLDKLWRHNDVTLSTHGKENMRKQNQRNIAFYPMRCY